MEYEERFNITSVKNVVNNFKTREENRSFNRKYLVNMSGKDRQ